MKALITGVTSGLGKELALLLSQQGIPLLLVARNKDKLESLQKQLSSPTTCIVCDLASEKERQLLFSQIESHAPDLVINNAGFGLYGPVLSHPLSSVKEMLSVNTVAAIEISQAAANALQKQNKNGTIVNISSSAAFFPFPDFALYAASKACLQSFSQAFDQEMKPYGIRVLTACPGQIDTPFRLHAAQGHQHSASFFTMSTKKAAKKIIKQIEKKRSLAILDWRYQMGIFLARLLPMTLLLSFLQRSLQSRIGRTKENRKF